MYIGASGILDFLWLLLVQILETTRPQAEQTKFKIYVKHGHLDYANRGEHFQSSGDTSITIVTQKSTQGIYFLNFLVFYSVIQCLVLLLPNNCADIGNLSTHFLNMLKNTQIIKNSFCADYNCTALRNGNKWILTSQKTLASKRSPKLESNLDALKSNNNSSHSESILFTIVSIDFIDKRRIKFVRESW